MHIKKGDTVIVLAGRDKGKTGKILKAMPKDGTVLVEGINMVKKHQKPTKQGQKGQLISKSMPMYASKVAKKA
jgi:large subunit ribosomal protein L24